MVIAAMAGVYLLLTSQMLAFGHTCTIAVIALGAWLFNIIMLNYFNKNEKNVDN